MTAIAYRNGILAADSDEFAGYMRVGSTTKIAARPDGYLAAASGRADFCQQFLDMFTNELHELSEFRPAVKESERDFSGLLFAPDGTVWEYTEHGQFKAAKAEWYMLGSAFAFLSGAMAAGASAEEAVHLAIKHRAMCGGSVVVLRAEKRS